MSEARDSELFELLEEVRRIEVQSRRLVTDVLAGGYRSAFCGSGVEFDEVREYVAGDDPRTVDWNVTARVGRPFVKKYVDERELTVVFVLDLSASMDAGFGPWSARQMAARICGCLALSAVRNDDKVGLIAASDRVDRFVRPEKGFPHALRIVRDALALQPSGKGSDLRPALELASRALRRHAVVFVISDFLSGGWEHALSLCARRHDLIAVRLLPPELDTPAPPTLTRLRDPESGDVHIVDWHARRVREAYSTRVRAWRERTESALRRAKADRMDVAVPRERGADAVARPLLEFFRMREARGAKR